MLKFEITVIRYHQKLWQYIGSLRGFAKCLITFEIEVPEYLPEPEKPEPKLLRQTVQIILNDIRIIEKDARLFIAMPSRRIMRGCARCRGKNCIDAEYCNWCSARLPIPNYKIDERGREVRFADISYPINQVSRNALQTAILYAYSKASETEQLVESYHN